MKHIDILEQLDPLRKVALVASGLDDEALQQAGAPAVGRVFLEALAEERGVPYAAAARSFDPQLVGRMTEELAVEAGAEGARLFVTPDLKTAANPYQAGLSEDACLSGLMGRAIAESVHGAGYGVGLSRLSLSERDVAYLDRREDAGAVHDLFVKPFLTVTKNVPCDAVFLTPNKVNGGYPDTNRALFSDVLDGCFGDVFAVGDHVAANSSALSLLRGKVTLGGAAIPLERAARRFARLKQYREEGSVSARDVEDAVREGTALDDMRLDVAADETIDFAMRLAERVPREIAPSEEARRQLAGACIVLLKNEKTLPLARGTGVAAIGEAYADLSALEERFSVKGRARGYDRATERSDTMIPEAVRAAGGADVVLLFLYPDGTGRSLAMPANRLALLQALKKTGKRIVGIVCGDMPADLSFDAALDAVLLAPADGPYAGEALARVLAGETDPAGRLTRTAYDGADAYFRALKEARDAGRMRIGGFVGYLRYATAGERVRYPFGYGLSYTKFSYSALSVNGDEIAFTVKNTGGRPGYEVAQVYVGAPDETHVVPERQLKAVAKVALKAGESRRVIVKLPADAYASYDPRTLSDDVEAGVYRVFVCSNALDVRLQGRRTLGGVEREPAAEGPETFFPDGPFESDESLKQENRLGNRGAGDVPKPLRNARRAAIFVFPVAVVLFFLLATVFIFTYALDYTFFSFFDEEIVKWGLYGLAVLMLAIIPLLGSLNRRRLARVRTGALIVCPPLLFACLILGILLMTEQNVADERIVITVVSCLAVGAPLMAAVAAIAEHVLVKSKSGTNRWAKFYFERQREETLTPDAEFEEAFRTAQRKREEEKGEIPEAEEPEEPMQFFDKELSYAEMLRDCTVFVKERGFDAEAATMQNLLAALSSAQLLLVPSGTGAALAGAVAEYFGKKPYIDNAEQYVDSSDLFTQWKQGERMFVQTELSLALAAAERETAFLHTVIIRHADAARLGQVFGCVADVLARRKAALTLPDGTERALPPNLRIVAEIEGEELGTLPPQIAEVAAALLPACKQCPPAEKKSVVQSVGFERFTAMRRSVRDAFPLGEEVWKNVDRLDGKCRSAHIGNLLWVKTEMHASVLSACGGDDAHALDGALACELLPWLCGTWDDEVCGEKLHDALAEIFGKNIALCKELVKSQGGGKARR